MSPHDPPRNTGPSTLPGGLLPLRAVALEFRFTQRTLAGPYHGPGLMGFVKSVLGLALPPALWLATPDHGIPVFNPGDRYRFVVYSLAGGAADLDRLIDRLRTRSNGQPLPYDARAFGPRWRFVAARDALAAQGPRIGRFSDLCSVDAAQIESEASIWAAADQAWLRMLSPLQVLRERDGRPDKGTGRFCQDSAELTGNLLLDRLRQSLDAFARRLGRTDSLPTPNARLQLTAKDMFWHGTEQLAADRSEKPVYGLGGVLGLRVDGADADMVWQWLTLAQHLGIGQRRGFGLGRYRLEGPQGEQVGNLPRRQASLLAPSLELSNLDAAWRAIRSNKRRAVFERELDAFTAALPPDLDHQTELSRAARELSAGGYEAPSLEGFVIDKPDGGQRALAVPPLLDRVLQRAVAQILNRLIEPVMYASSFGYRPGRNRMQARDIIQRLVREGYAWFFESDIDSFFDAVDPALVYNRLTSLLADDPAVDRIMRWVTAPVHYQGRLLQRAGLPQGSPLSPLLANLVLDDFDHDLVAAGFEPVRFADDFVVPCKTREQAERAAEVVSSSLGEKGLRLNDDQSRIARFSDGLKFLGYRFVNDLAVESRKPRHRKSADDSPGEAPHPESWLAALGDDQSLLEANPGDAASVDSESSSEVQGENNPDERGVQDAEDEQQSEIGEADATGSLIIVSEPDCLLFTREGRLCCQRNDHESVALAPWPEIGGLLLLGYQRCTQAVLHRAMAHRVPVYFTNAFGRLKGILDGRADSSQRALWLKQLEACESPGFCLTLARELVGSRMHHQRQVLRRRGISRAALSEFQRDQDGIEGADSVAMLRGLEGGAARRYFQQLQSCLPDWVGFAGRNRRPPRDPFNAMLSLGFTLLYSQADTFLRIVGLLPEHGFYHQARGRHAALASDLMETFRHLVESTALAQLNRRQLTADDFILRADQGCRMSDRGRRVFLVGLSERLASSMSDANGRSMTGHQHLYLQAIELARTIAESSVVFKAVRLK